MDAILFRFMRPGGVVAPPTLPRKADPGFADARVAVRAESAA